ncbi:MAG: ribosome recycling factor [Clostridia bacterium]|nr:ribosome recycling factor [Clostridia bacterium]
MSAYQIYEEKMQKTITAFQNEMNSIRAGRANPAVLDRVTVDYYGTPTPVAQVGSISVPEPHMIMIQPWDASIVKEVEKAIIKSEIGITPNSDGKVIRLAFPPLTEERRRELVKSVSKKAEDSKVAVRNVRRDALDDFKNKKKNAEITEDDLKGAEKDIQDLTDRYCKELDRLSAAKEKEIMEI